MKFLSVDCETTGLTDSCQVIELGVVLEDTVNFKPLEDLPKFHCIINWDIFTGQPYALQLNQRIFKEIVMPSGEVNIYMPWQVIEYFTKWLNENGIVLDPGEPMYNLTVAGKNFQSFDKKFIEKLPRFKDKIKFRHRVIDPAILFVDWKQDEVLPSLKECKDRAGIEGIVTHNAIDDALDVIKILRTKYFPQEILQIES